jgi:HK97 gp10 family phage protein
LSYKSRIPSITAKLLVEMDAAVRDTANAVVDEAQQRVPVDSGDLRDAIHIDLGDDIGQYYVVAGDDAAFYGHLVEFGTMEHPARPFLVPTVKALRRRFVAEAKAAAKRAVKGSGSTSRLSDAEESLIGSRGYTSQTHYVDTAGRVRQRGR